MTELSRRIEVRRHPERGIYDRPAIDSVLDEALGSRGAELRKRLQRPSLFCLPEDCLE